MVDFMIHFFLCNLLLSVIIGALVIGKRLLKNSLSSRMQYNLWFLLLGMLAVPFLPIQKIQSLRIFSWVETLHGTYTAPTNPINTLPAAFQQADTTNWFNDIGIAVSHRTPSNVGILCCILWLSGIAGMIFWFWRSVLQFHRIQKSALPLQNAAIYTLYCDCLAEMGIQKCIPIYSTAFLNSPVIAGFFRPCIYLPIHLIADINMKEIRYILLHELQHYKYKDALVNYITSAANALYWFNPAVWYALGEMKNDREVACDTSVLKLLKASDYEDYGNTLINFAEKVAHFPFPFAAEIGGTMPQMKKRILNIAAYQPASRRKNVYGFIAYLSIAALLSGFVPLLAHSAADRDHYAFQEEGKTISYLDLSAAFGKNTGSFVLYNAADDSWKIYNKEAASARVSPVSTFKIYSALSGLEAGLISPAQSQITWNGHEYYYETWNADQTLQTAMQNSVTWYFQTLDQGVGLSAIRDFVHRLGYGNQTVGENLSSYWGDSSLMISPIEQVEMLKKFYENDFGFSPINISAVKDSIRLYTTDKGTLSGKTGTGEENGQNVLGWFVGYLERDGQVYYFATNIQNDSDANGTAATALTLKILAELGFY